MTSNFDFLHPPYPDLAAIGYDAEGLYHRDPHACLMKLRFLLETLVRHLHAAHAIQPGKTDTSLLENIDTLRTISSIPRDLVDAMHALRKLGNEAAHEGLDDAKSALDAMQLAFRLASWMGKKYADVRPAGEFRAPNPQLRCFFDFHPAYQALPDAAQAALRDLVGRLDQDAADPAIRYLDVPGRSDRKVQTVALGPAHRAVIARSPRGDLLLLLWAGPTDDAIAYARDRQLEVHARTGALQVYALTPQDLLPPPALLFAAYTDEDLAWLGLPDAQLPLVRSLPDAQALAALAGRVPADALEALLGLARGVPLEDLLDARSHAAGPVDPEDFAAALAVPTARRRFFEVTSPAAFEALLAQPMTAWRTFLHPTQQQLAQASFPGPARVVGGAGTGKTVVLLHRARRLAAEVFTDPGDRLLVLTFTELMAQDLRESLTTLCGPELARIEVVDIHTWARGYLRDQGQPQERLRAADAKAAWDEAFATSDLAGLPTGFYMAEWDAVVVRHGLDALEAYLAATREESATVLTDARRRKVWQVFAAYRSALAARGQLDYLDCILRAQRVLVAGAAPPPYRAILVDEAQDMGTAELRLIRELAAEGPDDLFLVGDAYQRIYQRRARLAQCGIDVADRTEVLRLNYRSTGAISDWALAVLDGLDPEDLNGPADTLRHYHAVRGGEPPLVRACADQADEDAFVLAHVRGLLAACEPADICVTARDTGHLKRFQAVLAAAGIASALLGYAETTPSDVRLATMYHVKGLEFRHLLMTGVGPALTERGEPEQRPELLRRARQTLYATANRARDTLAVTAVGPLSELVPPPRCVIVAGRCS